MAGKKQEKEGGLVGYLMKEKGPGSVIPGTGEGGWNRMMEQPRKKSRR